MKLLLCYGSLRKKSKRGYNFNRFGGQKYLRTIAVPGYEMYSLVHYPAACEGKETIICELHEVQEPSFIEIQRMELMSGYFEKQIVLDEIPRGGPLSGNFHTVASLFVFSNPVVLQKLPHVKNGDWS